MTKRKSWAPDTLSAQALGWIDERTRAIVPAVYPSTTYLRDPDNEYRSGYSYTRDTNPGYDQVEALLAELEHGAKAMVFASGMAAASTVFQALSPGDHVIVPAYMYWGLRGWLGQFSRVWGLRVSVVPNGDLDALQQSLKPGQTRLVWIETPANPTWHITDIAAVSAICHAAGAKVCVDNTVPTPVLTRPLELGADMVMHSATKYLNGHGDVLAGALVTAHCDEYWDRIANIRHHAGAVLGPFEAWLLLRGMRTLYLRVRTACANAAQIADVFSRHVKVAKALYPGLADHPGHTIAARQMQGGFGGMLSLRIKGGPAAAIAVTANVGLWKRATSLGGVESLIEHRASIEGEGSPVPGDLVRLSVGIENPNDLIADLTTALDSV